MGSSVKQQAKVVELDAGDASQVKTFSPPNFTIKELLNAIPASCYDRSLLISSAYVVWDLALVATLGVAIFHADRWFGLQGSMLGGLTGQAARITSWLVYWWFQGLVGTGIWILAHECGHQAFSPSKAINNAVGLVLHSALLVPYHSWRISHARHHAATNHMTRDEVYVPYSASEYGANKKTMLQKADDILEDAPLYVLGSVLVQQLFGWQAYLLCNASGQAKYPSGTNHFNPRSQIFEKRHFWQIVISDIGVACTIAALVFAAQKTSAMTVMAYYGVPYLMVHHWLICITFLQHTDVSLPHYRASEWNFVRGALATQDRNIWNFLTHDISSTHVAHHLSSKIPFYRARIATKALKEVLGEHYNYTPEHWAVSLYKQMKECRYVDDDEDVLFFRNNKGEIQRKVVFTDSDSGIDGI